MTSMMSKKNGFKFPSPSIFMESGTCEQNASPLLSHSETGTARITALDAAAGVLTYNLKDPSGQMMDEKVALMFYNRADVGNSENIFAVGFVNKAREVCYNLYEEMRSGNQTSFIRRKAGQPLCYAGQHVTINATMSDTFNTVITVELMQQRFTDDSGQRIHNRVKSLHQSRLIRQFSSRGSGLRNDALIFMFTVWACPGWWFLDSIPSSSCLKLLGIMSAEASSFSTHRQCTLDFKNESTSTLLNPSVFIESGICEESLPPSLGPSESGSALFKKTPYAATGAVGVLTYDLKNASGEHLQEKMTVMFSNPFDFNLYCNWFAVGFFDRSRVCDYSLYDEMYKGSETTFVRDKAGRSLIYKGQHVTINASMSDTYTPVIKLEVEDTPVPSHRQCTIHFKNESKSTLLSPSEFMQRGVVVDTPPKTLGPSVSGSALFQNLPVDTWGAAGVMTYNVRDSSGKVIDRKVAIMFRNSSDGQGCQCSGNIFAVGLFIRSRPCDESLYNEMLNEEPTTFVRGEAGQPLSYDGQGVTIKVDMSAAHNSVIQVEFSDN
ncbi:uncharacterized protein V6R79_018944 [Siganus canaliculatus]